MQSNEERHEPNAICAAVKVRGRIGEMTQCALSLEIIQPGAHQLAQHFDKVIADGAAEAAIVQHHDLLLTIRQNIPRCHKLAVNVDLPKLQRGQQLSGPSWSASMQMCSR